jgi:predicted ATPase
MLEHIRLENFKASRDFDARLAPLTLLSGMNGSGKSTLLQALGLLRQSYDLTGNTNGLILGGELVKLGEGKDVISNNAANDTIAFEVKEASKPYRWTCICPPDSELNQLGFESKPPELPKFVLTPDFQYLQADRIVPDTLFPQAPDQSRRSGFLGIRGQFTADYLATHGDRIEVPNARCYQGTDGEVTPGVLAKVAPTAKLSDQVTAWMQRLSPGVRFEATRAKGTDEVLLRFRYAGQARDSGSNFFRPTNVGFGLTYSLPIVTACLAAKQGALLLLENPEAHLHPMGQAALGELLARCAADGVQIILETHSDHILNGIRLSVKRKLAGITGDEVAVHYFSRDTESGDVWVQTPTLMDSGRLSNWPSGFFDQWGKSIDSLLE